jgi:uncharacterized protein (TIGR03118 family)
MLAATNIEDAHVLFVNIFINRSSNELSLWDARREAINRISRRVYVAMTSMQHHARPSSEPGLVTSSSRTSHRVAAMNRLRAVIVVAVAVLAGVSSGSADTGVNAYVQTILVANRPELAPGALVDKHLLNPWGIALRPPGVGGHIWISNAGNLSTSTYIGDVNGVPLHQDGLKIVYFETPQISYEDGLANVTGQVYNAASDFPNQPIEFPVSGPASNLSSGSPVSIGTSSGSAKFVFVTTEGTIHAWRASTAESMDRAVIVKDYSDHGRDQITTLRHLPAFTGVAMSTESGSRNRLYVTDFQNSAIRVFDNRWADITAAVTFARPSNIPADFSPYNIQLLGGRLYVAYAAVDVDAEEPASDVPGPGAGHIVVYDLDGHIVREFADTDRLNSPWGLALAPANFGPFGGTLLVANFGDGTIAAFDPSTGAFRDYLRGADGKPIVVDKVWGLAFGNGVSLGAADSLYFTAGPNEEQDGVFGRLRYAGAATATK